MKKKITKLMALVLAMSMSVIPIAQAKADQVAVKPYIAFGADLKASEKNKVMDLLGVNDNDLSNYEVVEVTNAEEKKYLGSYLSASVIGSRALSSVRIEKGEEGSGIGVETKNISYCTAGMYSNALITAGIEDAEVVVAGPFELSGTAALVGAMKAYAAMTGQEFNQEAADAATNELVDTAQLGQQIGTDDAEKLVALAKQKVIEGKLSSPEEIGKAVDEAAKSLDVQLTDEQRTKLIELLNKIKDLDLDVNRLQEQAKDMYNKIKDLGIDVEQAKGILAKVGEFFESIGEKITKLFESIFG